MFNAERMDGLDPSAHRQRAKVVGTDVGRRIKGGERLRRCDEEASDFAGRLLEAPGRVHDVAMKDDRTAHLAHLAGDDLTQVQGRTQARLHAKALDEPVRVRAERRAHREEAAQRPRIGNAVGLDPGDDDLVTHVLVDLAAAQLDGFGDCRKHRTEEAMGLQRPEPLGDRGRAHHVDEEEEASLRVGPAILSMQKGHERAVADQARGLKHHYQDGNGHEREANRNQRGARAVRR
jgi:hypothetical protein